MAESKVKELKEMVSFGLSLGMAIDKSLADDGKISFADVGNLIAPIMKAPAAFMGADKALEELKNLDEEGKKEMNDFVKSEFDIADDKIEAIVEECIGIAMSAAKVVSMVAKQEEKPEEPAQPVA